MKVYIASSFNLIERVQEMEERLLMAGHEITVKWWMVDFKEALGGMSDREWYIAEKIREIRERNFKGIDDADVLIMVAPETEPKKFNGANIELGYALGKSKIVVIWGVVERSAMYQDIPQLKHLNDVLNHIMLAQEHEGRD